MSTIVEETEGDTIYQIDKVSEEAILWWFQNHWPKSEPVQLVMEGIPDSHDITFPEGTPVSSTKWKCILDPIDGTRGLMYDKRSAWILSGVAPQRGDQTRLCDISIAAMTEIPTTKQNICDQISSIRGLGQKGTSATRFDLVRKNANAIQFHPSTALDFRHGFSALTRFFPEGKALCAQIEEAFWQSVHADEATTAPLVFDDQYISTGGQFYEILAGHDRMLGDIRPLLLDKLGIASSLVCHPYDACVWLILHESGAVIEAVGGGQLNVPLDTTSPVAWLAFANTTLADIADEPLRTTLRRYL